MEGSAFGSYKAHPSSGIGARSAVQGGGAGAGGASDESPQTTSTPSALSAQPSSEAAPSRAAGQAAGRAGVLSFAEVTKTEGEWNIVQRRKPKTRSYRYLGAAGVFSDQNCNFKAADRKVPIFITMVHNETTERDIVEYVYNKTQENIKLGKISFLRGNKDYNAFKFFVPERKIKIFLDATLWPEGVIFRRFVKFRQNDSSGTNGVAMNTVNGPIPAVNG
ncbi:unnamed protein product [Parnassius apollo]|uniref:(apollo) hypothetical protein n=1 Tax=Parnassius apollo TaxID=110799 RepID=A0A8S3XRX4_PARAO|nr:unnamed protein product [Parnassius apollo]